MENFLSEMDDKGKGDFDFDMASARKSRNEVGVKYVGKWF